MGPTLATRCTARSRCLASSSAYKGRQSCELRLVRSSLSASSSGCSQRLRPWQGPATEGVPRTSVTAATGLATAVMSTTASALEMRTAGIAKGIKTRRTRTKTKTTGRGSKRGHRRVPGRAMSAWARSMTRAGRCRTGVRCARRRRATCARSTSSSASINRKRGAHPPTSRSTRSGRLATADRWDSSGSIPRGPRQCAERSRASRYTRGQAGRHRDSARFGPRSGRPRWRPARMSIG
jgi:hypothetical protein